MYIKFYNLEEVMSKGTRKREANALRTQQRLEREKQNRKAGSAGVTVAVVLILCLVVGILAASLINNIRLNSGNYLRNEVAVSSENNEVDGAMMSYFFNSTYNNFLAQYGSYLSYFGLDPSISLKQQMSSDTETWFDYIMSGTKDNVANILMLCEAAAENGVALTDAEKAAIRTRADETDTTYYGRGTKKNDIYNAMLLEALAHKYQYINQNGLAPTEDEIIAEYAKNTKDYQYVDYYSYTINFGAGEDASEDATVKAKEEAQKNADKLKAVTTTDDFKAVVRELLTAATPDMKEEDITAKLDALESAKIDYVKDNKVHEWAFAAKVGETYVDENTENSTFTVYLLTKEAYRDESATIDVRHVLLYDDDYGSREKAVKAAEKLLADFNAGDKSADAFGLIALEYSQDPGSCYTGGLYESVGQGQMVESFDEWCFDEARQTGDTGIVESDYGVHIMYFVGDGGEMWTVEAENTLLTASLEDATKDWETKYPITYDEKVIDSIPG